MTQNPRPRWAVGRRWTTSHAALLLVGCMLTQCVCQNSRKDQPPIEEKGAQATPAAQADPGKKADDTAKKKAAEPAKKDDGALPKVLNTKGLDTAEQALLAQVLKEQFDPCGKPKSFMDSLKDPKTCDRAKSMGEYTVDLVKKGLSKQQIVAQLMKELSRTTSKAHFDLKGSPYLGDPAAKHVIVEFMDFQCPFCRMAHEPAEKLAKKYGAVLYIKNLPLHQHPASHKAALAALAANEQGKFWDVYNYFFEHQDELDPDTIDSMVKKAGVDMKRWKKAMKSPEVEALLKRDRAAADRLKLEGTPTFFLDGYQVEFE